jgi:hypothetical protein
MKKCLIIIALLMICCNCFSQQIDNLYNLNYDYKLFDFHIFTGPIHYYENRLIVCSQNDIMEFNLMPNGELELVETFETKMIDITKSFIDEERFYFFYIKNYTINLKVFDISVSPMTQINDIDLAISFVGCYYIVTDNHLIITDSVLQRSNYYTKNDLEYVGYINNLYGLVTFNDSIVIKVSYLVDGNGPSQTILRFYDKNNILNYDVDNYIYEMTLSSFIWLTDIKIKDDILYLLGFANLFLVDISDVNNPQEMFNIYTETDDSELGSFHYLDANLYGDYLVTTTLGPAYLRIYNISDYQNIYVEFEDDIQYSHLSNTSIIYPYLYVCSWAGLKAYDMSNNYEIVYNYGKSYFDQIDYVSKDDFYAALYDEESNITSFYSALSNEIIFTMEFDFPFESISSFSLEENKLYLLYKEENDNYLNIYNLNNGNPEMIYSNFLDLESAINIRYINGFIYLTNYTSSSGHPNYVYQLIDNELVLYCTIPGLINMESGLQNINYIVSNYNNKFYFRDINAPDNTLFISNNNNINAQRVPYIMSNNYLAGKFSNNSVCFYKYNFNEGYFSHFYTSYYDKVNIFNDIITDNGQSISDISKYYTIINDQIIEIGSLEIDGAVSVTYFYPEYNKVVLYKPSGFYIYSFDYTVSSSDQVVEYERDTYVYPNPVNGGDVNFKTSIADKDTEISIYNIKGQLVKTSKAFQTKDNENVFTWDKRNNQNQSVSSGVYFYKIKTDDKVKTGKFLIMK